MKKILILMLILSVLLSLSACNYQMIDTTYNYSKAIVSLPDGTTIEGKVQSWKDYEDGDQIQVKIDDITYLVHSTNIVLISE